MHRWPARCEFYVGMPKTWKNGGGKGPNMSIPLRKKGPHTTQTCSAHQRHRAARGYSMNLHTTTTDSTLHTWLSVKTYAKNKIKQSQNTCQVEPIIQNIYYTQSVVKSTNWYFSGSFMKHLTTENYSNVVFFILCQESTFCHTCQVFLFRGRPQITLIRFWPLFTTNLHC